MVVRVFTEDNQDGILEDGWSLAGIVAGLFQVAVVAPGLQVILGIPDGECGGHSVEVLVLRVDGASALAALAAAGDDIRREVARRIDLHGWVRSGLDPRIAAASPNDVAHAIRILRAALLPT